MLNKYPFYGTKHQFQSHCGTSRQTRLPSLNKWSPPGTSPPPPPPRVPSYSSPSSSPCYMFARNLRRNTATIIIMWVQKGMPVINIEWNLLLIRSNPVPSAPFITIPERAHSVLYKEERKCEGVNMHFVIFPVSINTRATNQPSQHDNPNHLHFTQSHSRLESREMIVVLHIFCMFDDER